MEHLRIEGANYVTIAHYAHLKKVTRQTVYNWIKDPDRKITVYRLMGRQLIKID